MTDTTTDTPIDGPTAKYIAAYMKRYDEARAEGMGPTHASYAATKAADEARVSQEQHEAGNKQRREWRP